jgi:DNA-directed RNA polymerase subunit beta
LRIRQNLLDAQEYWKAESSSSVGRTITLDLVPERLRGETVCFDVKIGDTVLVDGMKQ